MKNKTLTIIIIIVLILLIIVGVVYLVNRNNPDLEKKISIASIWWFMNADSGELDFSNTDWRVKLLRSGFEKGMTDGMNGTDYEEIIIAENASLRDYFSNISDAINDHDVLMTIGANQDEETMYASMTMNYFKVPMLIPFADGDLSPDIYETDFSMRMTPTSQKYADFINELLPAGLFTYVNGYFFENRPVPVYTVNIGMFFADNFNGNETAVKIAQRLLDNGYNIEVYRSFALGDFYPTVQQAWNEDPAKMKSLDTIVVIGEDADPLIFFNEARHTWMDQGLKPNFLLIGYVPASVDDDLIYADNVFAIQPHLDLTSCPAEIRYRSEAIGYAAGQVMSRALLKAYETQPKEKFDLEYLFSTDIQRKEKHAEYISSFRSNVRSVLVNMVDDIPCYGRVNFKNDTDEMITLELVRYTDPNTYVPVDQSVIIDTILARIKNDFGIDTE